MKDSEADRSIHEVEADIKASGGRLTEKQKLDGHRFAVSDEQEEFLRNVDASEQDKIFRKV